MKETSLSCLITYTIIFHFTDGKGLSVAIFSFTNPYLSADDTSMPCCLENYEAYKVINDDLFKLSIYGSQSIKH